MAPSTFASAAAGANSSLSRTDSAEWQRRPNGATLTMRRPSSATNPQPTSRDPSAQRDPPAVAGVYVPPHMSRNGATEHRYSKDELLSLYGGHQDGGIHDASGLFMSGWDPNDATDGTTVGADVCWDSGGHVRPLGLVELSAEEREVFASTVNSPLKPPTQAGGKDSGNKDGMSMRKTSISHGQNGPDKYGLSSPTSARPNRRREAGDAYPFPSASNPTLGSRLSKDDSANVTPPPSILRRLTDFKDGGEEKEHLREREGAADLSTPISGFKRGAGGHGNAIPGSGSPWPASSPSNAFAPTGTFGNFGLGGHGQPAAGDKRPGFGSMRGESRFKGLMKDATEDPPSSRGGHDRQAELETDRIQSWMEARTRRTTSNITDPFPDDDGQSGSAALLEESSPHEVSSVGTSSRVETRGGPGLAAFGMTADNAGFSRDVQHETPAKQKAPQGTHEPMSPTDTNPYQSPDHERTDHDEAAMNGSDILQNRLPRLSEFSADPNMTTLPGLGSIGGFGRTQVTFDPAGSDRSQTSSAGPSRGGFPNLGGLGGLPGLGGPSGWSNAPGTSTPSKERAGFASFGDGMFGSMADLQSPNLAGLGSSNMFGPGATPGGATGTIGRGGKIGSLFPQALQDQMRASEIPKLGEENANDGGPSVFGSIGKPGFGFSGPPRDSESPLRTARSFFDEVPGPGIRPEAQHAGSDPGFTSPLQQLGSVSASIPPNLGIQRGIAPQAQPASTPGTGQPPPAQQRTMVMPDRMRWIYKDPQGNTQGPWSGLEMHEWYKAGYFTAELLVKKAEDIDYEPLASLIRRIGNSREPFLVPQIGIPHGPPTGHYAGGTGASVGTQPPFANSFPSFGTTLTAEQQNALERRKQEEQYLMARQKEHLAQQQLLSKQMMQGQSSILPPSLNHHGSAQSLQSQPSFGSITSPTGYQLPSAQGSVPGPPGSGSLEGMYRGPGAPGTSSSTQIPPIGSGPDAHRPNEVAMMERLSIGRGQQPPAQWHQMQTDLHSHQAAAIANERARLQREQSEFDSLQQRPGPANQQAQLTFERLQEFHDLRKQIENEQQAGMDPSYEGHNEQLAALAHQIHQAQLEASTAPSQISSHEDYGVEETIADSMLSLSEQVQKVVSAKQTPTVQSPWQRMDPSHSQPLPPPQSNSPMPAPVAQRKQNVAEALHAESRSQNQTPSVDTPSTSLAPWAKDVAEPIKGPSLKEIQEAEARKAAQQEEVAAAARRAILEREMLNQKNQAPVPAPGLPSSSTWGNAQPPTPQAPAVPPWAKPTVSKAAPQNNAPKKTLQQIQNEEEARKRAAVAAAAAVASTASPSSPSPSLSTGKRYADLASKVVPAPSSASGASGVGGASGAWMTVGAGGKPKLPATTPTAPAAIRSNSTANVAAARPKPVTIASRSTTAGSGPIGQVNAHEEFKKWGVAELRHDLNKGINVDDFVQTLLSLPSEMDVITEAVHSVSQTMDSRHFAEEFIRRNKLAAKGIVETTNTASPSTASDNKSGGWSEVAKKGGSVSTTKEEPNNFRVVAAKKKGGKR
ncbi:hypothetical protein P152DRAFT_459294 [Eremomyces bilateralis CBS 781.70]|uniref:GYF domain-containing protein n=1 Tax=Eremomyces bilateralis CBS 781.70 TaxID=1392243 RepID=A0A6G1G199_9PEZI|nr:uncharacterized protein P152DRAFT_459294 [Eremomyces bilateralis CBS 781.70]KAF1811813.1 hypothetical protein P152DRAFT_459294 [Eremomyces bilateralis CBS 781.70]